MKQNKFTCMESYIYIYIYYTLECNNIIDLKHVTHAGNEDIMSPSSQIDRATEWKVNNYSPYPWQIHQKKRGRNKNKK